MVGDVPAEAGVLRSASKYFGAGAGTRITLVLLASLLVWVFEAFLLAILWSARGLHGVPKSFYLLPIVHLLPWLATLQCLRKVRHAVRSGVLDTPGASICYSVIIALLFTAYVALSACEISFGLAWRFGTKIFLF